jgi:hypothetical protein
VSTSLAIIVSFIFFIEVLIAIRIFRKRRKEHQSGATNKQPVIIILNQTPPPTNRSPVNRVAAIQPNRFLQKIISSSTYQLKKGKPSRFHQALCLGPIFLITYLGINYLLRPFTFSWILIFLPVLLVIPFLVLPSFFNLKSFATFCCLIGGLGLGGFMLFLLS